MFSVSLVLFIALHEPPGPTASRPVQLSSPEAKPLLVLPTVTGGRLGTSLSVQTKTKALRQTPSNMKPKIPLPSPLRASASGSGSGSELQGGRIRNAELLSRAQRMKQDMVAMLP